MLHAHLLLANLLHKYIYSPQLKMIGAHNTWLFSAPAWCSKLSHTIVLHDLVLCVIVQPPIFIFLKIDVQQACMMRRTVSKSSKNCTLLHNLVLCNTAIRVCHLFRNRPIELELEGSQI